MYRQFNIQQFYVQPTQCICVLCVDLRTNSHYFPIQYYLTGFYNRDKVSLLRGTDWVFMCNKVSLHTVKLSTSDQSTNLLSLLILRSRYVLLAQY